MCFMVCVPFDFQISVGRRWIGQVTATVVAEGAQPVIAPLEQGEDRVKRDPHDGEQIISPANTSETWKDSKRP
jgi:hypothetical protein